MTPPLDVVTGGRPIVTDLVAPLERALDVPAGSRPLAAVFAGTIGTPFPPVTLHLPVGAVVTVYAVGSALSPQTLRLVVQPVPDAPARAADATRALPAGPGWAAAAPVGQARDTGAAWPVLVVPALAALALLAGLGRALRRGPAG